MTQMAQEKHVIYAKTREIGLIFAKNSGISPQNCVIFTENDDFLFLRQYLTPESRVYCVEAEINRKLLGLRVIVEGRGATLDHRNIWERIT